MKKFGLVICLMLSSLVFTACSGIIQPLPSNNNPSLKVSNPSIFESSKTPGTESNKSVFSTEGKEKAKIMIAYFSRSGNTKQIADVIHEKLGGDIFKIETIKPYADDYDTVLNQAKEEQRGNMRPELSSHVDNMDDYDVIFIGYPIWWGNTPMAVLTFLEEYDFSGKTIIPFCTYGSGGSGQSFGSVKSAASGATVLEGFSCRGADAGRVKSRVEEWLNKLDIPATN